MPASARFGSHNFACVRFFASSFAMSSSSAKILYNLKTHKNAFAIPEKHPATHGGRSQNIERRS